MKKTLNKLKNYYYENNEKFWISLISFVILPIGLIYFNGLEKGILKYIGILIIVLIIPFIMIDMYNFLFKKVLFKKSFYFLLFLLLLWVSLNIIYNNIKVVQYGISFGIMFFVLYQLVIFLVTK